MEGGSLYQFAETEETFQTTSGWSFSSIVLYFCYKVCGFTGLGGFESLKKFLLQFFSDAVISFVYCQQLFL